MIRRLTRGVAPAILLFLLVLLSLYLLGVATEKSEGFAPSGEIENLFLWMLVINTLGLLVLVTLIGANLGSLIRSFRRNEPGSRLNLRMVVVFIVLAVLPVTIVYGFSLQFLHRGIDSWFKIRVEKALEDALVLSQTALDLRKREWLRGVQEMASELAGVDEEDAAMALGDIRARSGASELTLVKKGRIIAFSSNEAVVVPRRPSEEVLLQLQQGHPYIGLEPDPGGGLQVRVAVTVPAGGTQSETWLLQALFPLDKRISDLAGSVQSHFTQYKALAYQREPLKKNFSLTLTMVLLLSLLTAVWAALFTTRRLVAPIRDLAEGTRAVAAGNYDKRLPAVGSDELAFLVRSFNDMTRRIGQASAEARRSQQHAEEQRAYLEAVLANLSSGVITIDRLHRLRTVNAAASHILGVDLQQYVGQPLGEAAAANNRLRQLTTAVAPMMDREVHQWEKEVVLTTERGRRILICRGTSLQAEDGGQGDQIMVFDEVTALVQAQRDAAWGEVARRLAHEIKNPLTPIQLSAERLRRKYLKSMPPDDAELLDRSTHTIVQQVEALKEMVNAFSDYARAPRMQLEPVDLNALIREVLDLYSGIDLTLRLADDLPQVEADPGRLRQVLHNLVKNALEAMETERRKRLEIGSRRVKEQGQEQIEVTVRDYGPGFENGQADHFFEPYMTTKPKGTGLGLAVVKKIVEEHGGAVWVEDAEPGARIHLRFPAASNKRTNDHE